MLVARAELTHADYLKCNREIARGQVKRVIMRGPLVGYYFGCPACGFIASYLHDDCGFHEMPEGKLAFPKTLVRIDNPPTCYSCQRFLTINVEDGKTYLEAHSRDR